MCREWWSMSTKRKINWTKVLLRVMFYLLTVYMFVHYGFTAMIMGFICAFLFAAAEEAGRYD